MEALIARHGINFIVQVFGLAGFFAVALAVALYKYFSLLLKNQFSECERRLSEIEKDCEACEKWKKDREKKGVDDYLRLDRLENRIQNIEKQLE